METYLRNHKHEWPYLSWNDIETLCSPYLWIYVAVLSIGLLWAGRKPLLVAASVIPVCGFVGLLLSGGIASYFITIIPFVIAAVVRCNRLLGWTTIILFLIGDALLIFGYFLGLMDYNRMTGGTGIHHVPGELWEGMQNDFAFLITYLIATLAWGIYFYATRPAKSVIP